MADSTSSYSLQPTAADVSHPDVTVSRIAFGSCHKRKYVSVEEGIVWKAISDKQPDVFLWTGDAVYPPLRGVASVDQLRTEYDQMLTNVTLGYTEFHPPHGIYGTWDDHDYGGNDLGNGMPNKPERRDAFFDFLGHYTTTIPKRDGVHHSIEWGHPPHKVKVILLDTRWHRQHHCVPSVATFVPLGAALSCITRWITAGLKLPFCNTDAQMLGEEQWQWLQQQLQDSDAQVHVVVSSVQVLTTNPVMESWGHFVEERQRLLSLLNGVPGLVLLSGDVHHAEVLDVTATVDTDKTSFVEVTSSGLTHSCTKPFYGGLCQPLLDKFPAHRYVSDEQKSPFYFIDRNFGTIDMDWSDRSLTIRIHNHKGEQVFSVGPRPFDVDQLTELELSQVAPVVDGHLIPLVKKILVVWVIVFGLALRLYLWQRLKRQASRKNDTTKAKIQ